VSLTRLCLERCCGGDLSPLTALRNLSLSLTSAVTLATLPLPPGLTFLSLGSQKATKQQVEGFWGPAGVEGSLYQCAGLEHLQIGFDLSEGERAVSLRAAPSLTRLGNLQKLMISAPNVEISLPDLSVLTQLKVVRLSAFNIQHTAGHWQFPVGCLVSIGSSFSPFYLTQIYT
jgi:hypothetical protein